MCRDFHAERECIKHMEVYIIKENSWKIKNYSAGQVNEWNNHCVRCKGQYYRGRLWTCISGSDMLGMDLVIRM